MHSNAIVALVVALGALVSGQAHHLPDKDTMLELDQFNGIDCKKDLEKPDEWTYTNGAESRFMFPEAWRKKNHLPENSEEDVCQGIDSNPPYHSFKVNRIGGDFDTCEIQLWTGEKCDGYTEETKTVEEGECVRLFYDAQSARVKCWNSAEESD